MKLATSILATGAMASHYRGGTYKVRQTAAGNTLDITHTQTWRKGSDMYWSSNGGCRTTAPSDGSLTGSCSYMSGGSCGTAALKYTALFVGDDYCYGDGDNQISKPSSGFSFGWGSCCWVSLTKDNGSRVSGGSMAMRMTVNDVNNTSPSFKLPPLWLIMAGCPNQQIDLAPSDADGDNIKCRWATASEAGGAYYVPGAWSSLSLDANNCIVKYDGTLDSSTVGVKPIGLMMEDFDANGNVRSSIPVQFLAQVWTPNMATRSLGAANYPEWFAEKEHKDHVKVPGRGRRSLPAYCNAVPTFVAPTPADGHNISGASGSVSFTLAAQSKNGKITSFSYQAPSGMTCTTVNSAGQITCTWNLTAADQKILSHSFCYDATDNLGLVTNRQCLTISGRGNKITNIKEMAAAVLDGSGSNGFTAADGKNYGCAGRGDFNPFSTTVGAQVDANDKAFYTWKKCIQCQASAPLAAYDYDQDADSCAKSSAASRGICECDRALVNFLYNNKADNSNYPANQCVSGGSADTACCNWNTHMWGQYNTNHQCCDKNAGIKDVGTC